MEEKEKIQNIITCGIRWGSGNPSFEKLSLENNIAILGGNNKNFKIFDHAKLGTLIALKNGHSIIALGMYKDRHKEIPWSKVFDTYIISENRKYTEDEKAKLADKYGFDLEETVDAIEVEKWVSLKPPIYYSMRMSTVNIRQNHVIKECKDRFKQGQLDTEQLDTEQLDTEQLDTKQYNKQYNKQLAQFNIQKAEDLFNTLSSEDIQDHEKRKILENALSLVEDAQKLDPSNTEALNLKNAIESDPIFKKEQRKENTVSSIRTISWIFAGIGIIIFIFNGLGLYALTVNRLILMAGILVLIFIPFITSLKLGIFNISFEKEKNK